MYKKIISIEDAPKKILAGVEKIGNLVGSTLGPGGKNVVIYRKYGAPLITNDGVTVARYTVLENEIEDLGAQAVVETTMKTNEKAGDGTTTSAVLAAAIIKEGFKKLGDGVFTGTSSAMALYKQILSDKDKAIDLIKKKAHKLKKGELKKVVTTSLEDEKLATIVTDMVEQLGINGYISVEDNWATQDKITTDIITGAKFYGTYCTPWMITNEKKEAIWEDTHVLVCNHSIQTSSSLGKIIKELKAKGVTKLVIITSGNGQNPFEDPIIKLLALANKESKQGNAGALRILGIKAPALTSDELTDISCFVDAKFLDSKTDDLMGEGIEHLGFVKKIAVNEDEFVMFGGRGDTKERVKTLEQQLEIERDTMFKEKLKRRVASLTSGVGIIRVGASTENDRGYLKLKLEDAVSAAKAALEEGVVPGGGLIFKEIAEELGKDSPLYKPLQAPYEKIQENAGGQLEISPNVIDPAKVSRLALENACSAAILITTGGAIAERKQTMWDQLERLMFKYDEETDFRDNTNQDRGNGRLVGE